MSQSPSGAVHPTVFVLMWATSTFGLQYFWPLVIPEMPFLELLARIVIVFAILVLGWAQWVFWKHGATADHAKPASVLITEGPYRFSRNPIYLALILIFTGLALAYGNGWGLLMVAPFAIAVYVLTVLPEEAYLQGEFGPDYTSYRNEVRRWL